MANEYTSSTPDSTSAEASRTYTTLKAKVQDVGTKAAGRADRARVSAASGLDTVASTLHKRGDNVASAAHHAADAVHSGAEYLRAHDVETMTRDLMDAVRRNPGLALLGAAALGLILGRALSRD
jgi:ElaB/YqjD/DUF883 family membrane-anchored ribosome-binding protein